MKIFQAAILTVVLTGAAAFAQQAQQMRAMDGAKKGYDVYMEHSTVTFRVGGTVVGPMSATVAREAGSGMATGKRMHKPLVITHEIDRTSPVLAAAMAKHEAVSMEMTLDGGSKDAAKISGGKASVQDISILKIVKVSPTTEEITADYGSATVQDSRGGVMSMDDWSTR
jgi:type VI secretion system secreted protein Hcp